MFENASKVRVLPLLLAASLTSVISIPLAAAATRDLNGQWTGASLLEGQRETAKTTLELGANDEGSTLRIESRTTCTLKRGNYAPLQSQDEQAWSLTFKDAQGGEACERLAQGKFVVRAGSTPRTMEFDVVYPNRDGTSNHRHGMLSRYP
jgi:hypothetical protein